MPVWSIGSVQLAWEALLLQYDASKRSRAVTVWLPVTHECTTAKVNSQRRFTDAMENFIHKIFAHLPFCKNFKNSSIELSPKSEIFSLIMIVAFFCSKCYRGYNLIYYIQKIGMHFIPKIKCALSAKQTAFIAKRRWWGGKTLRKEIGSIWTCL